MTFNAYDNGLGEGKIMTTKINLLRRQLRTRAENKRRDRNDTLVGFGLVFALAFSIGLLIVVIVEAYQGAGL